MKDFAARMRQGGDAAIQHVGQFLMKTDPVHETLHGITRRLHEIGVPHAVAGAMALAAHGYVRATVDIDILITADGLRLAHDRLAGLGYGTPFDGSKNLVDAATGVRIEFLVTGGFPGDGKPKPVAFPDPRDVAVEMDGVEYLSLPTLVELKLASGMTAPGRLKDLADVQELIRSAKLPNDFDQHLHPYVREKYQELWTAVTQCDA